MDQKDTTHSTVKQSTISEFLDTLNKEFQGKRASNNIISIHSARKRVVQSRSHQNDSIQSALNYAKTLDW